MEITYEGISALEIEEEVPADYYLNLPPVEEKEESGNDEKETHSLTKEKNCNNSDHPCLVAHEENTEENEVNDSDLESSPLQEAYNDFQDEFLKLVKGVGSLRKKNAELENTVLFLTKTENQSSQVLTEPKECVKCEKLFAEKEKLGSTLHKFTKGSETLDIILNSQKDFR